MKRKGRKIKFPAFSSSGTTVGFSPGAHLSPLIPTLQDGGIKMVYSNLQTAFMYEFLVGVICVLGLAFNGEEMIVLMALMGLRPIVLSKKPVLDLTSYRRFYNQINTISFAIMAISLIILIFLYHMSGNPAVAGGLNVRLSALVTVPAFLIVQGLVALILLKQSGIH